MEHETFAPLADLGTVIHAFTRRGAADTKSDEHAARFLSGLGFSPAHHAAAEQTHGNGVAVVSAPPAARLPGVDALVTNAPGLPLVIRCADCAAVYVVDRARSAIALIHSGRAGTLANIVSATLATMQRECGTVAADCLAVISPSIGPCHYEMDLWTGIENQLRAAGVRAVFNPRVCTACQVGRYYSYRAERGRTGRMLALLALRP
jgi:copper oxidase (laccase) domain-containing protein